jgi:hypothetical protein
VNNKFIPTLLAANKELKKDLEIFKTKVRHMKKGKKGNEKFIKDRKNFMRLIIK